MLPIVNKYPLLEYLFFWTSRRQLMKAIGLFPRLWGYLRCGNLEKLIFLVTEKVLSISLVN
ncbi:MULTISPECIES: hypothetical protein [Microcystis]|nr:MULTISPECIES: hypothetical protein [Microcystis]MCZ8049368.1 hypothetical protein [Microcystis sp. LE19-41.2A]MCZ8289444.1 hypothetical protein [Microcystis sp. LE19-59.1C]BCU14747.1 hypothetical protein MAN88_53110 [Microcystis aeruginosa]